MFMEFFFLRAEMEKKGVGGKAKRRRRRKKGRREGRKKKREKGKRRSLKYFPREKYFINIVA